MLLPGGTESRTLGLLDRTLGPRGFCREGRGEIMRGGLDPPLIRGAGGSPPENFVKSMYLRTHFKPFEAHFSIFYNLNFKLPLRQCR